MMLDVAGAYAASWPLVHALSAYPAYKQKGCVLALHCAYIFSSMIVLQLLTGLAW